MSDEPMLPGDWPEPVKTADMIIGQFIEDALKAQERFSAALNRNRKFKPCDESIEAKAARFENALRILAYVHNAAVADLLITIQGLAPGLADQIIREWDERGEAGDCWPEMLWEWAAERGLDPDQITKDAKAEVAKRDNK